MDDAPALERLLRRDRTLTAAGLAVLCALAWFYLLSGAGMGQSAWAMTRLSLFPHGRGARRRRWPADMARHGDARNGDAAGAPGAAASGLLTVGHVVDHDGGDDDAQRRADHPAVRPGAPAASAAGKRPALAPTGPFAAGYLLVWLGFSMAAAVLHWGCSARRLLSAAVMGSQSRWLSGRRAAGGRAYQLSPLKTFACATAARRRRSFAALAAGRCGALRLGCCTARSASAAAGADGAAVRRRRDEPRLDAALTLLVLAEKLVPGGGGSLVARA